MKRIGILTSGGDAPGMNAAIRSVVRVASDRRWTILGIKRGYAGLMLGDTEELGLRSVSGIIQRGGTILKTSRSKEFETPAGQQRAKEALERHRVDGLLLIGGDGTFRGAADFARVWQGRIVGIPGTIDNDLSGTDFTIGFDTAVNTALEAIDKIRDTAEAHERFFVVEVMGRHAGFIALEVGIAGGAEEILLPESPTDLEAVCARLCQAKAKGKTSSIVVVAEGDDEGGAFAIAKRLSQRSGCEHRVVVLGHLQRGGSPTAQDRVLATKLGAFAVEVLERGETGVMVGEVHGTPVTTPFEATWRQKKSLDQFLLKLVPILAA